MSVIVIYISTALPGTILFPRLIGWFPEVVLEPLKNVADGESGQSQANRWIVSSYTAGESVLFTLYPLTQTINCILGRLIL